MGMAPRISKPMVADITGVGEGIAVSVQPTTLL
jgi:hypothetical protein